MTERLFKRGAMNGVSAYVVTCSCGHTNGVNIGNSAGCLPPAVVQRKLIQRGWDIGKDGTKDRCPSCVRKAGRIARPTPVAPIESPMPDTTVTPLRAEPVRPMTRGDRQIIFTKLQDVYPKEDAGYTAGWSDERVAADLGVPRAWVVAIREENFGGVAVLEDPRVKLLEKEITSLKVGVGDRDKQIASVKRELTSVNDQLSETHAALQVAYGKIERLGIAMRTVQELGTAGYDLAYPKPKDVTKTA